MSDSISITPERGNKKGIPLEPADGSLVIATYSPFEIYKSTDNGVNWTIKYGDNHPNKQAMLHFIDRNGNLYYGPTVAGVAAYVVRSTDNGDTWTKVLTVESSGVWRMAEDINGYLYVSEYSSGSGDANELYAYNVWRSINNGVTWAKWYENAPQSTPGAKDSIRHIHLFAIDSGSNMFITFGDLPYSGNARKSGRINSDATLGAFLSEPTAAQGNGWISFVEADNGALFFGTDFSPNKILKLTAPDANTFVTALNISSEFGTAYDSPIFSMIKGKDGVLYALTEGTNKIPVLLASSNNGGNWKMLLFTDDNTVTSTKLSLNFSTSNPKIFIGSSSDNYFIVKDYTKAELDALFSPETITPSILIIRQG